MQVASPDAFKPWVRSARLIGRANSPANVTATFTSPSKSANCHYNDNNTNLRHIHPAVTSKTQNEDVYNWTTDEELNRNFDNAAISMNNCKTFFQLSA